MSNRNKSYGRMKNVRERDKAKSRALKHAKKSGKSVAVYQHNGKQHVVAVGAP